MDIKQVFYFGCWGCVGHYLFDSNQRSVDTNLIPFDWHKLDTKFIAEHNKWVNGKATLTIVDGHTILSFPDNSVDHRPASHSTFIAGGVFSFKRMVELSKLEFDKVWSRYNFEVTDRTSIDS